ncbi:MAG: hypothetical protein LBI57_01530 [Helicobacteraceae bacterium]|jgi:hypothetical protein|nr:hypothetical protein [Helicobacteraceae bacterium]
MRKLFLAALCVAAVAASAEIGDYQKGERLFYSRLAPEIGLNGADFAMRHARAEWRRLFENRAAGFIAEVGAGYPSLTPIISKESFIRESPHLLAFLIVYAKDGEGFQAVDY